MIPRSDSNFVLQHKAPCTLNVQRKVPHFNSLPPPRPRLMPLAKVENKHVRAESGRPHGKPNELFQFDSDVVG
ncbi:MAG: hypothetical protein AMXMBFR84_45010 [Candidatus Hydrogenedentota bacterium]